MRRDARSILAPLGLVLALSGGAWEFAPGMAAVAEAASTADESRLAERLDAETAAVVRRVVQEARAAGLPSRSLVAKALEGATKRASGPRIVAAVRAHAAALGAARAALGQGSAPDEIVAAAGALVAGIPADTLARLRAARPHGSLVVPLVVLSDLVARRVPGTAASSAVLEAARAGVRDEELLALRSRVEHDIAAGASPATAATLRSRALVVGKRAHPPADASRPRAPSSPLRESP